MSVGGKASGRALTSVDNNDNTHMQWRRVHLYIMKMK